MGATQIGRRIQGWEVSIRAESWQSGLGRKCAEHHESRGAETQRTASRSHTWGDEL